MTAIGEASQSLIQALNVEMDMNAGREQRAQARQFLEVFRETSPICAPCGFFLASKTNSPVVRHNGFLLVEHCIKFQWNTMEIQDKLFIKETLLKLVDNGTHYLLEEQYHIKNALAKSIVEIIKREWPQQWPTMFEELYTLAKLGPTQTELVLLILLVLSEDVIVLQDTHVQRRREIYVGLTADLAGLFAMFTDILQMNVTKYIELKNVNDMEMQKRACTHYQVASATLATLVVYLDWVPVAHIMNNDAILLHIMCSLLEDERLRNNAVECLLVIASRRGNIEDRKPLMELFGSNVIGAIFRGAKLVCETSLQEKSYKFLKQLCQLFVDLGSLLCSLVNSTGSVELPATLHSFMEVTLSFTTHPSQILSKCTFSFWYSLYHHEQLSKSPIVLQFVPNVIMALAKKLIKEGFPSRNDFPSCAFSKLDFDCDEDFVAFLSKCRGEIVDILRLTTVLAPQLSFGYAAQWLQSRLQKPIDTGNTGEMKNDLCTMQSPAFLEWDAMCICLEIVMSRIPQAELDEQTMINEGIAVLERVLAFQTQDPLILSSALSCISALLVFVEYVPRVLPAVLDRIFSNAVFSLPGQTKSTRTRSVKNVRRHACSCLVKICKLKPKLLLNSFDKIYQEVQNLSVDREQLSQMEKTNLTEALILLSNEFCDFQRQAAFLQQILAPVTATLLSEDMKRALSSMENFIAYIGMDKPPVEPGTDDLCGINRSQVIYCIDLMLATIKRSSVPKDPAEATRGGFYSSGDHNTPAIIRNPVTEFVIPLLPSVLQLIKLFNSMWLPGVQALISPQFVKASDIMEVDKYNALGLPSPSVDTNVTPVKQPLVRMQHFLSTVHDNCHHILGSCATSLSNEFYCQPNLGSALVSTVCTHLTCVPDYRLRPVIRAFMKPFVQGCPPQYYNTTVIPVLYHLCPFMFNKLSKKWQQVDQKHQNNDENDEDNAELQEILEEQLHRLVTKEHVDLLIAVLLGNKTGQVSDTTNAMEEEEALPPTTASGQSDALSELGMLVFKHNALYPSIVMNIFNALCWNDTTVCIKVIPLCLPSLKQLIAEGNLNSEEAKFIMRCILLGLQQHGQHESTDRILSTLGFNTYQLVRPLHADVTQIMLQIPGCTVEDLETFDSRIFGNKVAITEKKKKEHFRKLVTNVIGKSVGQMFGRQVLIKDLPKLFTKPKPKQPSLDEFEKSDIGFCQLFDPKTTIGGTGNPMQ